MLLHLHRPVHSSEATAESPVVVSSKQCVVQTLRNDMLYMSIPVACASIKLIATFQQLVAKRATTAA